MTHEDIKYTIPQLRPCHQCMSEPDFSWRYNEITDSFTLSAFCDSSLHERRSVHCTASTQEGAVTGVESIWNRNPEKLEIEEAPVK